MTKLPHGFLAAGVYCGLKRNQSKLDISLIYCEQPVVAAGVYTRNQVCAAPVILDRMRTPSSQIRAVITNSGNANACTGEQGMQDAKSMAALTATACDVAEENVLVMSTGVIGELLDMQKVASGIQEAANKLAADEAALRAAAEGILTTDTVEKIAGQSLAIGGSTVNITGIAKGSGMIAPNMATMLGVIMTDARLEESTAQTILERVVGQSFNCISVDGHMSTNDTVLLLACGAAVEQPLSDADLVKFEDALVVVCQDLARAIVDDGEGAAHLIEIHVTGCAQQQDAIEIAKSIGNSPLVKTAIAGCDPNWGRIVSAAGYAGPQFDPAAVTLQLNGTQLYAAGVPQKFDVSAVSRSLKEARRVSIELSLGSGTAEARFWTCDLTAEYVRINADYHT